MKTKRILAFLLAMVMMISLVPTFTFTASAATTEKNVMLGTAALSEYDSTNGYDYIYYGTYDSRPIKWRILSMNGNSGTYTDGDGNPVVSSNAMFMLSEYALKKMAYDADKKANSGQTYPNNWRYSDIWNWCNNTSNNTSFISSSFTPSEKAYLLKTSKSNTSSPATDELNADTFFLLSEKEVGQVNDRIAKMASDPSGAVVWWWIRSPNNNRNLMNIVYKDGTVMCTDVNSTKVAARPAFNLNMGSILFTVPAKNGKSTTSGLQKTTEYTGTDYKLTIKDSSRGFKITNAPQSITTDAGKQISFTYENATVGDNDYISAMLVNKDGEVTYYGQLQKAENTSGTITITLPSDIAEGKYTLKLFNEQTNGDYKTDFSSAFSDVALTIGLGGSGTEADPYLIYTLSDLEYFRDKVNGGNTYENEHIKLTADIDMSSTYGEGKTSWTPIGNETNKFKGTFDGSGFTIKNLYCTTYGSTNSSGTGFYYGLFGYLSDGTIKNLSVSGTVIGQKCAGGVVGQADNSDIINCCNYCTVTITESYVGGIVGRFTGGGSVKNCGNNGTVTGSKYVSSIIGYCDTGETVANVATVENCYNTATIDVTTPFMVGGIVGVVSGKEKTEIKNCYNTGNVAKIDSYAMGILGYVWEGTTVTITNCYFLNTCATMDNYGTEKTADEFASGEVAWLLQNGQTTQVWGQSRTGDETDAYPVLTSDSNKKVNKITFMQKDGEGFKEYSVKYVNNGKTLGTDFPAALGTDGNYDFWWSENKDKVKFDENTEITKDTTVYAMSGEITEASDESDTITLNKNTEITPIDLSDYVKNKSGNEKNFAFALAEGQTLPDGLIFDESTGIITGTPAKVGTYTVKFNVANNGISLMSLENVSGVDVLTLTIDVDLEGEGTKENPYLIYDLNELEYFRDKVNGGNSYEGKYVKLMDNIDMTGFYGASVNGAAEPWAPIGFDGKLFNGTFDGNGKEIQNIYVNVQNGVYIGLFGNTGTEAMIKNLGVTGSVVGEKYVGGIIGGDNGTIEHCYYKGTVTGKKYVGGIVGSKYVGDIINCYCTGKISGTEDVGGITGYNGDTVKNCYSVAEVSGNTNIGGAIGKNSSIYKEVSNCYYLDGSVTKGNDSGIGTAKTEADFNSGEVAWALQNGQTDKAVQVWGQTVNETDNTKNDKYPVFTSEADKKVYKVAQTANTPIGGEYTENSAVYSNDNQTLTLNGYKGAYTNRFYGWAKEKDSRVLITEYAISKPTQRFTAYGTS